MRGDCFFAHEKNENHYADREGEGEIDTLKERIMRETILNIASDFVDQDDGDEDDTPPEASVDGFHVFDIVRVFGGFFGKEDNDEKDKRDDDPIDKVKD